MIIMQSYAQIHILHTHMKWMRIFVLDNEYFMSVSVECIYVYVSILTLSNHDYVAFHFIPISIHWFSQFG